jgi:hypothetical protein
VAVRQRRQKVAILGSVPVLVSSTFRIVIMFFIAQSFSSVHSLVA